MTASSSLEEVHRTGVLLVNPTIATLTVECSEQKFGSRPINYYMA